MSEDNHTNTMMGLSKKLLVEMVNDQGQVYRDQIKEIERLNNLVDRVIGIYVKIAECHNCPVIRPCVNDSSCAVKIKKAIEDMQKDGYQEQMRREHGDIDNQ